MSRGVIAAGHPLTVEAGAEVLREGGNAVDAAVGAVLTSFIAESPLTGFGAGGFMLVHAPGREDVLLDFFVEVPGRSGTEGRGELVPIDVYFDETPQTFNTGPASCAVPGTPAGLAAAAERFGSMPLRDLAAPAIDLARQGVAVSDGQAGIYSVLAPILTASPEIAQLYAPEGEILGEGATFKFSDLEHALEALVTEGPDVFYTGEIGRAIVEWVGERGGVISADDLAAYEVVPREPIRAHYRGRSILTNPPPSSGGILIALCLDLLDRYEKPGVREIVEAMDVANRSRGHDFSEGLYEEGFAGRFLADRLGSTTHIAVIDSGGMAASVTCSNGSGSGVIVPGTGVHLNNMLGEEDLNPLGFHSIPPGRRMPSMMAPTVVLNEGSAEAALGSAGSNRLRSAILLTILRLLDEGLPPQEAIDAGRLHFEEGVVQAEPGVDDAGLAELEARGLQVARWKRRNLFFGGVQAVSRSPDGSLDGGGDPRRGGVSLVVE